MTRLIPSTGSSPVSRNRMPRARATTSSPPRRPKMAPDAPTAGRCGARSSAPNEPANSDTKYDHHHAAAAEGLLGDLTEDPQRPHVHGQVDDAHVQEARGEEAVALAVRHAHEVADGLPGRRGPHAAGEEPAVGDGLLRGVEDVGPAAQHLGDAPDQHVEHDEGQRDDGSAQPRSRAPDDLLAAAAHALGAVEPDRRLVHALRADGPVAALADHARGRCRGGGSRCVRQRRSRQTTLPGRRNSPDVAPPPCARSTPPHPYGSQHGKRR